MSQHYSKLSYLQNLCTTYLLTEWEPISYLYEKLLKQCFIFARSLSNYDHQYALLCFVWCCNSLNGNLFVFTTNKRLKSWKEVISLGIRFWEFDWCTMKTTKICIRSLRLNTTSQSSSWSEEFAWKYPNYIQNENLTLLTPSFWNTDQLPTTEIWFCSSVKAAI